MVKNKCCGILVIVFSGKKESIMTLLKHDVKSKVVSVRTLHKLIITGKVRLKN